MKLYDIIGSNSVIHEIYRICGANTSSYPIQDIVARVGDALDKYLHLAFRADGRHSFDDINESNPPIDTQDLVSGTNRYKFSAFTEEILSLVKVSVLKDDTTEVDLTPERMGNLSDSFLQTYKSTDTGTPSHYIKYGDFIYLRPYPNYNETGGLRVYFNRPASKFDFLRFTVTQANPGVFTTASAHGMSVNDLVIHNTNGTIPTGITANTIYYIKTAPSATTYTVASTLGGTAIEITANQTTSVQMCLNASKAPGIPTIHHPYLARHASLPFLIEKGLPSVRAVASQISVDELAIVKHFARRSGDVKSIMTNRGVLPR